MKDLIIIGASGFGREVLWLVERINEKSAEWNILGFVDDDLSIQGEEINGYKVIGTSDDVLKYSNSYFVCAVGASHIRKKVIEKVTKLNPNIKFATVIDPSVEMSKLHKIGVGTIICAHTILTVNFTIGDHVIINLDCTVGHDVVLGDFDTLYPSVNVSGAVTVGKCTELGTGSQIIQCKNIGENTIIGAGAVVVSDIPDKCTAVGCPAKPIRFFE